MRTLALALIGSAAMIVPAAAQAQTNPLSSIFQCENAQNRQGAGAAVGGVLGGLLGNTLAGDDDETLGTVLGAAIGAAAGSYIGCNMTGADETRAEDATRRALNQGRATTWTNARTGASGRIDIVNTFYRNNVSSRVPDPYYNPNPYSPYPVRRDLNDVQFARGVLYPANYTMANATYRTDSRVNVRAGPTTNAAVLTQLQAGERFEALARTDDWLLVGRNGVAVGYVAEWVVDFEGYNDRYADNRYDNRYPYNDPRYQQTTERQLCRTFDQTIQNRGGYNRTTERFTACQTSTGEWMIQS